MRCPIHGLSCPPGVGNTALARAVPSSFAFPGEEQPFHSICPLRDPIPFGSPAGHLLWPPLRVLWAPLLLPPLAGPWGMKWFCAPGGLLMCSQHPLAFTRSPPCVWPALNPPPPPLPWRDSHALFWVWGPTPRPLARATPSSEQQQVLFPSNLGSLEGVLWRVPDTTNSYAHPVCLPARHVQPAGWFWWPCRVYLPPYALPSGFLSCAAATYHHILRRPLVLSYHTHVPKYVQDYFWPCLAPLVRSFSWLLVRNLHASADLTLTVSEPLAKELRGQNVSKGNVEVWQRGVDSDLFNPKYRSDAVRHRLTNGHPERTLLLQVCMSDYR